MIAVRKVRLSIFVGFLALLLFLVLLYLMRAAVSGEVVARWVLLIIFGTVAVVLASFGIGYVLLLFVEPRKQQLQEGKEYTYRRQTKQEPMTWINVEQLQQEVQQQASEQGTKKQRRPLSRKRR